VCFSGMSTMSHGASTLMESSAVKDIFGICAYQQSLFVVVSISPVTSCKKELQEYHSYHIHS